MNTKEELALRTALTTIENIPENEMSRKSKTDALKEVLAFKEESDFTDWLANNKRKYPNTFLDQIRSCVNIWLPDRYWTQKGFARFLGKTIGLGIYRTPPLKAIVDREIDNLREKEFGKQKAIETKIIQDEAKIRAELELKIRAELAAKAQHFQVVQPAQSPQASQSAQPVQMEQNVQSVQPAQPAQSAQPQPQPIQPVHPVRSVQPENASQKPKMVDDSTQTESNVTNITKGTAVGLDSLSDKKRHTESSTVESVTDIEKRLQAAWEKQRALERQHDAKEKEELILKYERIIEGKENIIRTLESRLRTNDQLIHKLTSDVLQLKEELTKSNESINELRMSHSKALALAQQSIDQKQAALQTAQDNLARFQQENQQLKNDLESEKKNLAAEKQSSIDWKSKYEAAKAHQTKPVRKNH